VFGTIIKKDTNRSVKNKRDPKSRPIEPRHFMTYRQSEQYILNIAVG